MERTTNPTEQKLLRAFMQFKRAEWHQRSIEGCTPSEIRVLFCIKKSVKPDTHEMKVSEISKHLHVTAPTITQLLKGLEAHELIERRVSDAVDRALDPAPKLERVGRFTHSVETKAVVAPQVIGWLTQRIVESRKSKVES